MGNNINFRDKIEKALSSEFGEIVLKDYAIIIRDHVRRIDEDGDRLEVYMRKTVTVIFDLPIEV